MLDTEQRFRVNGDEEPQDAASLPPANGSDADRLAELRALLVGPERHDLESLHQRLDDADARASDLAEVLPEAIARREKPDKRLAVALAPTIENAFRASIRKNSKELADAISPVLAPAIRKAIRDALQRMVQSLQTVVNHSLSPQSFKWRLEAWRTGVPFGQVVLARTLVYQVEQVFLIHRETGLQLLHVVAPHAASQDADMVAGMLTAIRDFAKDAFPKAGDEPETETGDESLYRVQISGLTVWVEQGPKAYLAAAIRGIASEPERLQETFRDALDAVHIEQGADLDAFQGDASPFERSRPTLEQCLVQVTRWDPSAATEAPAKARRRRAVNIGIAAAAGLVLLAAVVWLLLSARADRRRWEGAVERVRQVPGVVVTEAKREGGRYVLSGLRDPLSQDPLAVLGAAGIDRSKVTDHWPPYYSLDRDFVRRRAAAALSPPASARLALDDAGTLRAEGEAPGRWAADARRVARALPGIAFYDDTKLANADLPRLTAPRERIERCVVRFVEGSVALKGMQEPVLDEAADQVAALAQAASDAGVRVRVEVVGAAADEALARRRAESIRRALVARGAGAAVLVATSQPTPTTAPSVSDGHVNPDDAVRLRVVMDP